MFCREESNENILVFKLEDFDKVDEFTIKMVRENPISGTLILGMEDNNILMALSNLVPLDEFLRGENCSLDLEGVMSQYRDVQSRVENYMIPKTELILNYEFAYATPDDGQLCFPLVPSEYSYFETHTEKEFALCVKDALPQKKAKKAKKEKAKRSMRERFLDVMFSGNGDDIFEFENEGMLPDGINVIKVRSTGAEYPLLFGPDTVGTDDSLCSIPFPGKEGMEAEHCVITLAHGKYNIADLNSKGGTLLNGLLLEPGKTYELRSADLITVAGEELVFLKRD